MTSATASTTCTTSASSTRRARSARSTAPKQQYLSAVRALQTAGIQVYADIVLNHRIGGDAIELVKATPFPQDDRLRPEGEPREIEAYTHFRFAGRNGRYSAFEWHSRHFDAVDYDHRHPGEQEHGLPVRGQEVRRPGGARERQLLVPDGLPTWTSRQPGGARRGDRLGQVVPRHDRRGRLPTRRGQAHRGLVLPGVARRDGEHTRRRTCSSSGSTGRRTSTRCTGISTASAAASRCSTCRCTTTSTTRAAAAGNYDMRHLLDGHARAASAGRTR